MNLRFCSLALAAACLAALVGGCNYLEDPPGTTGGTTTTVEPAAPADETGGRSGVRVDVNAGQGGVHVDVNPDNGTVDVDVQGQPIRDLIRNRRDGQGGADVDVEVNP
jgi:hypothetical protein